MKNLRTFVTQRQKVLKGESMSLRSLNTLQILEQR